MKHGGFFRGSTTFPGAALKPDFLGVAGTTCWAVVTSGRKVITWTLDERRVWTGEWSAFETEGSNDSVQAAVLVVEEAAKSRTTGKRKKTKLALPHEDGLALFSGSTVLIKPPSNSSMPNCIVLRGEDMELQDGESITSLAGAFLQTGEESCRLFVGTDRGRVLKVAVDASGIEYDVALFFEVKPPGILARIATPWRRAAAQPKIVAIQSEADILRVLTTESALHNVDPSTGEARSSWSLPQDHRAIGLGVGAENAVLVAAATEDTVAIFSGGEILFPATEWTSGSLPRSVQPMLSSHSIVLSCQTGSGVKLVEMPSMRTLNDDLLSAATSTLSRGVVAMTLDGKVVWERGEAGLGESARKLTPEAIQRHLKGAMLAIEEAMIETDGDDTWARLIHSAAAKLALNADFIELGFTDSPTKTVARQKLLEYVVAQLGKEADLHRKMALVAASHYCLELELEAGLADAKNDDQEADEDRPLTLQLIGEVLFGAVTCMDKAEDALSRCQLTDDFEHVLSEPQTMSEAISRLCRVLSKGRDLDAALLALGALVDGVNAFTAVGRTRGSQAKSAIVHNHSSTIVGALMDASKIASTAGTSRGSHAGLSPDRVRRFQAVCASLLEASENADTLGPLLNLASTTASPATDTGRSIALVAAKELAEKHAQFGALISACLEQNPEDLATVERCLKKWETFPIVLFGWLLARKRSRTAFALVERLGADEGGRMHEELIKALHEPSVPKDLLWLGHVRQEEWNAGAEALRRSAAATSVGILCAFAAANQEGFNAYLRGAIKQVNQRDDYLAWLQLALTTAQSASEKDYVWANAVLCDVPVWRSALKDRKDSLPIMNETIYCQLMKTIRDRRNDSLGPGPDFFENLEDNLGERVGQRGKGELNFNRAEVPKLQALLRSLLF